LRDSTRAGSVHHASYSQPTLSVHALGPRALAHHFPVRTAQPTFFSLSSGAIRTVHHALQRLIAVRSLLRRSSFFPHCFLANALYLHGSLHTTPPLPLASPPHLQQWRSPVRRRRRHRRPRRRFPCRYVPTYLCYFSQPTSPQLNPLH
jgi:hypothetical protein